MQAPSTLYELFILGKLMHRPMHGYLLQSIVNAALGPFRRLGWGTLYPLLRKLEKDGLIAVERVATDSRGTRAYRTTARGRTRFLELMRSGFEQEGDFRDLFRVKLANFGHLALEDRRAILAGYRDFLAGIVRHSQAMIRAVTEAEGLAAAERPHVLNAIVHQRALSRAEIRWVDALLRSLA